jgi:hypothetical protein
MESLSLSLSLSLFLLVKRKKNIPEGIPQTVLCNAAAF